MTDTLFDPSELSELDRAREALKELNGELVRLNTQYMILLKERDAEARAARTSAHKQAWRHVAQSYSYYLVGEIKGPFVRLCGRIANLPDSPGRERIKQLKEAARDVATVLAAHDDKQTAGLVAEVTRLRDAVQAQAEKLHNQFAQPGRCECPGCELVRSLDDGAEVDGAAGGESRD